MSEKLNVGEIVERIKAVLPETNDIIALHEPQFRGNEWAYVKECIDSGWVSSVGKFVDRFEQELAEYTGTKKAVVVVNGTAALHVCLMLAGVKAGDEVIVPALTFIATANAVAYCAAVPHFVDSAENTLGIDPAKLRDYLRDMAEVKDGVCRNRQTGRPIRAVVPMHAFGHPVDLDELCAVCEEFSLVLIEDAAESIGSCYKGRHTGNWGKLTAVSFNGNKVITTGGGGAILTNDPELARQAKHLTTQAKVPHRWEFCHDQIAYNYRMPNINAALGCAQLERLSEFVDAKRALFVRYQAALQDIAGIRLFKEPEFARSNYWLHAVLLDEEYAGQRDELLAATNDCGIMTRPVWNLLYTMPMYHESPRMACPIAESIGRRLINLPSSAKL